jgi:hypothetical protein
VMMFQQKPASYELLWHQITWALRKQFV